MHFRREIITMTWPPSTLNSLKEPGILGPGNRKSFSEGCPWQGAAGQAGQDLLMAI